MIRSDSHVFFHQISASVVSVYGIPQSFIQTKSGYVAFLNMEEDVPDPLFFRVCFRLADQSRSDPPAAVPFRNGQIVQINVMIRLTINFY